MSKVILEREDMVAIADAVRSKTGETDTMTVGEIAAAVYDIEIGNGGSSAIIDVVELPKENININAFYRLMITKFICDGIDATEYNWLCYCVNGLPETGLATTNADMNIINAYYNTQDGIVYGYLDETLAAGFGYPAGWYEIEALLKLADVTYGGIINDISEDTCDGTIFILLKYDFYMYQDGWCQLAMGYEKTPEFDIQWDGDMSDKLVLDMSALGYDNTYFVKVSNKVLETDDVIGWKVKKQYLYENYFYEFTVEEYHIDTATYPGAYTINDFIVVVYNSDTLASALGIPSGIYTNGIYFWLNTEDSYISRFTSSSKITKIDEKFLPEISVDVDVSSLGLHSVATSGNYNDLNNKPTIYTDVIRYNANQNISSSGKQIVRNNIDVYSKSEVNNKISDAIGAAIGGSY